MSISLSIHQDAKEGNDDRYASNRARSPQDDMDPWFGDSSGALFAMYLKTNRRKGFEMAKRWEKCAVWLSCYGSILMAVSCGLTAVSRLYIKPGSQNEPVPRYAHIANELLQLALAINLTCVGGASVLMQCSRTYVTRISQRQANIQNQFTVPLIFLGILFLLI